MLLYFWQEFPITSTHFEPRVTAVKPTISLIFTAVLFKQKNYSNQSWYAGYAYIIMLNVVIEFIKLIN